MATFNKRNWGTGGQTPQTSGQSTPQTGGQTPQANAQPQQASGFQKRTWGSSPGGQQSQFRSDLWNLNVKFAKYTQNGSLAFKLSGFKWEDEARMNKIAPDVFFIKKSEKTGAEGLIVKADKVEEFRSLLPTITDELRKCNHYTDTSVNDFAEKIEATIEKTPTQDEINANNDAIITNWKQLLQSLNDPETNSKQHILVKTHSLTLFCHQTTLSKFKWLTRKRLSLLTQQHGEIDLTVSFCQVQNSSLLQSLNKQYHLSIY